MFSEQRADLIKFYSRRRAACVSASPAYCEIRGNHVGNAQARFGISESIPTIHTTDSCTKSINERPTRIAVRGVGINSKRNDHENYTHMIYVGIENALPMQCSLNAL